MIAFFSSMEWKKSDKPDFITRKPGEKKPTTTCKEFKRNLDGSIVYMVPKKSEYLLILRVEDGTVVAEDVYGVIKYYNPTVRITKKFREKFESFMSTREYNIENGFIYGLYSSVEVFFQMYKE